MMIVLQLVLYCLLFFLLVKAAAGNDGLRCLYFYPKEYQEEAFRRGTGGKRNRRAAEQTLHDPVLPRHARRAGRNPHVLEPRCGL